MPDDSKATIKHIGKNNQNKIAFVNPTPTYFLEVNRTFLAIYFYLHHCIYNILSGHFCWLPTMKEQ